MATVCLSGVRSPGALLSNVFPFPSDLIACAAFLQIGKADPTRDQVHGMGIWYT